MSTPLLSIGMIVKDEIRCIERCFKSLEGLRKDIPCELVVADTGSTDGTREIAEKYADIVFDFEWCNDFSAARNAVIDRCTGQWHMQIDADEWLSDDYQGLVDFLKNKQSKKYNVASLCIRNHHSTQLDRKYSDFTVERILRIDSGFRYKGEVHESLRPPIEDGSVCCSFMIENAFLHHDGYMEQVVRDKNKGTRNMDILLPMLEKQPDNIRLLCECIESTALTKEKLPYIERGLGLIREGKGQQWAFGASLIRHAIVAYAAEQRISDMESAWELGQKEYPQSLYIFLDGAAGMVFGYYSVEDYEQANKFGLGWYEKQQQYEKNPRARLLQTLGSFVISVPNIYEVLFECLCQEKKWKEAETVVYHILLTHIPVRFLASFIDIFIDNVEYFSNPFKALHWVVVEQEDSFNEATETWSWNQYSSILLAKMETYFRNGGELCPVIAQLETDIGWCAKALLQQDVQGLLSCAEQIKNWGNIMSLLYETILEKHLLFPVGFYQQNTEIWASVAGALTKLPGFARLFLSYAETVPAITIEQKYWYSSIASALLTAKKWDSQTQAVALCRCFAQVDQELVAQMYLPQILTDTSIHLIPIGHRFSWYLKQAFEAIQTGKLKESIAILRKALESAPVYNAAIDALLDYVSTLNSSPELLALAEKIRGILSQYSPDDPAVQAIKESAAYQKVAYLIDGVNPPVVGGLLQ